MNNGIVYLVGAGPGDEGLITVKGKQCLEKADVVLYDRLVNPLLLQYVKQGAELIYCGKLPDKHVLRQENINELLVEKCKEGKVVVRLKGGDPSVFGRVGEEAARLAEESLRYEIVPGVTSSIAAASYAGIPVTHREFGGTFAVVSGHDKSASGQPTINWEALANAVDTIAFYMGVGNMEHIANELMKYGKSPDTPVILIQWGTYGRQKLLKGTLATIAERVNKVQFKNPAITLVGGIVHLHETLAWFHKKPLFGRDILLARTGRSDSRISKVLKENGAGVFEFPSFEPVPLFQTNEFEQSLSRLVNLEEDLLFLSPESVHYFFEALSYYKIDVRKIKGDMYTGSIKSQRALQSYGCFASIIEENSSYHSMIIFGEDTSDRKEFYQSQSHVRFVPTHRQQLNSNSLIVLQRLIDEGTLNTIVFPSAESVKRLVQTVKEVDNLYEKLEEMDIICFGDKTKNSVRKAELKSTYTLDEPTAEALVKYLAQSRTSEMGVIT